MSGYKYEDIFGEEEEKRVSPQTSKPSTTYTYRYEDIFGEPESKGYISKPTTQATPTLAQATPIAKKDEPGLLSLAAKGFGHELTMGYMGEEPTTVDTVPEKIAYGAGSLAGMIPSFALASAVGTPLAGAALATAKAQRLLKILHGIGKVYKAGGRDVTKLGMAAEAATKGATTFGIHGAAHATGLEGETLTENLAARAKAAGGSALTGAVFGGVAPLAQSRLGQIASAGAVGAGMTAVGGGETEDILIQGGLLSALSALHIGVKDAHNLTREIAKEIDNLPPREKAKRLNEIREANAEILKSADEDYFREQRLGYAAEKAQEPRERLGHPSEPKPSPLTNFELITKEQTQAAEQERLRRIDEARAEAAAKAQAEARYLKEPELATLTPEEEAIRQERLAVVGRQFNLSDEDIRATIKKHSEEQRRLVQAAEEKARLDAYSSHLEGRILEKEKQKEGLTNLKDLAIHTEQNSGMPQPGDAGTNVRQAKTVEDIDKELKALDQETTLLDSEAQRTQKEIKKNELKAKQPTVVEKAFYGTKPKKPVTDLEDANNRGIRFEDLSSEQQAKAKALYQKETGDMDESEEGWVFFGYHPETLKVMGDDPVTTEIAQKAKVGKFGIEEKPSKEITQIDLIKRYVKETGEKVGEGELDKVKKKYPEEWAKIEKADLYKKELWNKLPEDFKKNRGINEYSAKELEKISKQISEAKTKEPITETKARLIENIKSEKGSSELINDISRIGADVIQRGYKTFKDFAKQMKVELAEVWDNVKHLIRRAYDTSRKILTSEKGKWQITGEAEPDKYTFKDSMDAMRFGREKAKPEDIEAMKPLIKKYQAEAQALIKQGKHDASMKAGMKASLMREATQAYNKELPELGEKALAKAGVKEPKLEIYRIDEESKVVNTQGKTVTLPKGEDYMAIPLGKDKNGIEKYRLQDGKQVTVYEGQLDKIKGTLHEYSKTGGPKAGMIGPKEPKTEKEPKSEFKKLTDTGASIIWAYKPKTLGAFSRHMKTQLGEDIYNKNIDSMKRLYDEAKKVVAKGEASFEWKADLDELKKVYEEKPPEEPEGKKQTVGSLSEQQIHASESGTRIMKAIIKAGYKKGVQSEKMWHEAAEMVVKDPARMARLLKKAAEGKKRLQPFEAVALRKIHDKVTNVFDLIMADPHMEESAKIESMKTLTDAIFPLQAEASAGGRFLRAFRDVAIESKVVKSFTELERSIPQRDKDLLEAALKEIREKDNYKPAIRLINYFNKTKKDPKLIDYVVDWFYGSILSGPPTQLINAASNTTWLAWNTFAHRAVRSQMEKLTCSYTGRTKEYYLNEIIPALAGAKEGWIRGKKLAGEVAKKGYTTNLDADRLTMELGQTVGSWERSPYKWMRKCAPAVGLSYRGLRMMDVWANQIAFQSELHAIAKRMENKGLGKYEDLLKNPTPEMMDEATKYARYCTFMDEPGRITKHIEEIRKPYGVFIIPFVRTISNLLARGIEMTPSIGLLGKSKYKKTREYSDILAKQAVGVTIGLIIAKMCDEGLVTGPVPSDKNAREAFYRQGKVPWAIKIGDKWHVYRRIEPFNLPIATIAIAYQRWKESGYKPSTEFVLQSGAALVENFLDSSYVSGVNQLLDSIKSSDKNTQKLSNYIDRLGAAFIPYSSFWRSTVRATESAQRGGEGAIVRKPKGLTQTAMAGFPITSTMVPAKKNVWGEDVVISGNPIEQWLPWKASTEKADKVEIEIDRLHKESGLAYPGMLAKYITVKGQRVDLDDAQYDTLITTAGKLAKTRLDKLVGTAYWKLLSDEDRVNRIERVMRESRKTARNKLKKEMGLPTEISQAEQKRRRRPFGFRTLSTMRTAQWQ